MDLNSLLRRAVELGASDVHLKLGRPPILRRDGELAPLQGAAPLEAADFERALAVVAVALPYARGRGPWAAAALGASMLVLTLVPVPAVSALPLVAAAWITAAVALVAPRVAR